MRVAFVLARLDCNDGVASHVELLAHELVQRGVVLTMITGVTTGEDVAAARYEALRRSMPDWHKIDEDQLRPRARTLLGLARILRRGGFDLVHVHGLGLLALARLALLGSRIPVVATYHPSAHGNAVGDFALNFTPKQRRTYRLFLKLFRPERIIALSRDTERLFTDECGLPRRMVAPIIGGIDTDHFRPPGGPEREAARRALGVGDDTLTCVLPGRLNLNKGHDLAVAALDRIRAEHPGWQVRCVFPGAGAQEAEIRAMVAKSRDPGMFILPGFVADMRDVYWASDIVILPSRNEGFALVVAEAMACGCAAIRTPSGGVTDQIVEGETGFVVPFNDPAQLSDRILRLREPGQLRAMRANAGAHAQRLFSGRRMGAETAALYAQLVQARPGRRRAGGVAAETPP